MITKLLPKREVKTKNGKTYFKRPKVQRLITPRRITRKLVIKVKYLLSQKIKEDRRNYAKTQKEAYEKTLEQFRKNKKQEKKNKRKTKSAQKK